jgi:predicted RNase H-like HicB family nuclease
MNPTKYAVVIERGDTSFGAYVPDLPGCVAVAKTKKEVEKLIAEAIAFHIEGLLENGDPVPPPSSEIEYIEPAAVA